MQFPFTLSDFFGSRVVPAYHRPLTIAVGHFANHG
jgi:hypothetical protein